MSGPHAERWARTLAGQLGPLDRDPVASAERAQPSVARDRMRELARVEAWLVEARRQAAALREGEALASLAAAERAVDGLADVPGSSAWAAEVQLQLGAVAAQAGLISLAQVAFRRAASLEPSRRLLPAEAAPEVVALCARAHAELAAAPTGVFTLQVSTAGARVFLDDAELGGGRVRARAVVGRHALRIEAPGHRTYGSFIDVLSGERPAFAVQLTPLPRLELARELARAVRDGQLGGVASALRAAGGVGRAPEIAAVLIAETAGSSDRALLVRCDRTGCRGPTRAHGSGPIAFAVPPLDEARLAHARAWLWRLEREPGIAPLPLWKRWYVWGGAAIALTAGAVALGFALQPEPERRLRVQVDGF
ncbi:MAG TPA: PEGA domain-containing protein [Polyangiales bacterium]|nr:PEGA domain-containing protein [Polyangiales bacterium]